MTLRQIVCLGDSLTQGTGPSPETSSIAQGGQGNWCELVAERLSNLDSVGPLVSSGFRGMNLDSTLLAGGDNTWTRSGAWTAVTTNDAFDKACYGHTVYGNGSDRIYTFTKPSRWRTAVGFALYYVDMTGGGDFQYRKDGGTYTLTGQTFLADNKLAKFYVAGAFSTVDIRCYNGTAGVNTLIAGIEVFYQSPATTTGLIVHNLGCNGERLHNLLGSVAGDRLAFVDNVKVGTNAITNAPNAGVTVMHINDVAIANTTTWGTDLTTLNTRVSGLGPVGFLNPWEAATATYNQTQQTNYRAQTTSSATSLSARLYDIYNAWSGLGFTANAGAVTAGFLIADAIHESQNGHLDLANRLYGWYKNTLLGLGTTPTTYTAIGKQAAVVYTAKPAAVQYSAALPVGVG